VIRLPATVLVLALSTGLAGCTGADDPASPRPAPTSAGSPSSTAPTPAGPVPRPENRSCYRLDYDAALAPTTAGSEVDCAAPHTSMTYAVGALDEVARACPQRLTGFLGGTPDDLRLSMLRSVWFTPTVEESDSGADWFRCDVIALAADGRLAPLTGRLAGVLDRPEARRGYGMCGTAEPGTDAFDRVICSRDHSWRAIRTVGFEGDTYPGEAAARAAGQQACEDAARDRASDALSFRWGYEWPTPRLWEAGQTYGLCWAPD
jgi:hypothetical protein